MADEHNFTQVDHELLQATGDPWLAIVHGYIVFKSNGSGKFWGSLEHMAKTLGISRRTAQYKVRKLCTLGRITDTGKKKYLGDVAGQGAWTNVYAVQDVQGLLPQDAHGLHTRRREKIENNSLPIPNNYKGIVADAYNAVRGDNYRGTVQPAPAALQQQFIEQLSCELPDDPDAACAYVQNQLDYRLRELKLEPLVDMAGVLAEVVEAYQD